MRPLLLAVAVVTALAALTPSAQASVSDTWTHWVSSKLQSDIHSVDFTTPAAVFAGSYGDGIFNSVTSQTGPWNQQNDGIPLADQQINQVYASGPNVFAATSGGLYRGTDPLDGGTWTKLGQVAGEPRQLFDAVNSVIVTGSRIVVAAVSGGFMYSDDAGAHWDRADGTDADETAFQIISVGPALVAGSSSGVYVSFDQGSSWELRSDGLPFADVLRVAVDPTNPSRMYALAGDEVFKVDLSDLAKGALWTPASGAGPIASDTTEGQLPNATSLTVAPSGYGAGKIFVGSNDGVFATGDSGTTWGKMASATSAEPGIDPMGQQKVLALALGFPVGGSGPLNLLAGTPHGLFWIQMDPLAKAQGKTDAGAPQADATPRPGDVVQAPSETTASQSFAGSKPYFFTYQWVRCTGKSGSGTGTGCSNISGETGPEHVVDAGSDIGKYLAVNITARNIVSPTTIVQPSRATTNKVAAPVGSEPTIKSPINTYYPTLTPNDSRVYGSTYTLTHGTWVRADNSGSLPNLTYKYQWERCDYDPPNTCHKIPGTTSATTQYTSTPDDIGSTLQVTVTATDATVGSGTRSVSTSSIYGKPADLIDKPRAIGEPYIGETLSSTAGTWKGQHVTFTRQWERCDPDGTHCTSIINATDPEYKLTEQDRGESIRILIESDDQDQFSHRYAQAESDQTATIGDRPIPPAPTPTPTPIPTPQPQPQPKPGCVTACPVVKLPLSAPKKLHLGSKLGAPKKLTGFATLRYQWLRNGKRIKHATHRTYKLTKKDRGKKISCRITAITAKGGKTHFVTKAIKVPRHLKANH